MFKGDRLNEENDSKYRSYAQQLDKALKAFEGTSRWPDLIYAISRLIKVCSLTITHLCNIVDTSIHVSTYNYIHPFLFPLTITGIGK